MRASAARARAANAARARAGGELRSVETVVDLDVQELADDELEAFGPIMDTPGTSPEEEGA